MLELFTGFFKFTHALAKASGKGRQLFSTEENKDEDGDDEQLRSAERPETCEDVGDIHGFGIVKTTNGTAQASLSLESSFSIVQKSSDTDHADADYGS